MKISNKKLEKAIVELTVAFESDEWKSTQDKALNKLAKSVKIDGFRPGKAPVALIKSRISKASILQEASDMILQDKFVQILTDAQVEPVAQPTLSVNKISEDELEVVINVPVKPEVELGEYKGLEVKKGRVAVTKKEIEEQLSNYQSQFAELSVKEDGKVAKGDTAVIDYEGFIDGEAFDGGKAENYDIELGSNTFIPGFEDQIVGMKIDEEKDVNVKFPDEYFSKELAGKDATFKVKLHEIKKKELPKLDDEFAKDVSEFDTLDELKADIKTKLEKQNADKEKYETEEAVVKALCENVKVDIPSGMVETEVDRMLNDFKQRLSYQGLKLDQYLKMLGKTEEEMRKEYEPQAIEGIKSRLAIEAVIKAEKIEATDKEIEDKMKEMAKNYGKENDEAFLKNENVRNYIKEGLESEKAIDFLIKNAKIKK